MIYQEATGAGNVPERTETYNKCVNTSNMTGVRIDNGSWLSGSEVVVLAWDTSDTHTDNFWKLLKEADVTSGSTISTGDFTPKNILWYSIILNHQVQLHTTLNLTVQLEVNTQVDIKLMVEVPVQQVQMTIRKLIKQNC